ncbi:DB module domain-containing protein [Ditylenchus destructor]|uniref:DB module domain-containing protein n=1 Tax=Ditylenchus destructor TaxID=166010 RepID=A0AAD4MWU7_9BILA|nr:DB module domain-containing protein [Ditylenchus destructor]
MYKPALYILGSLLAVTLVAADLPSCYRARCTHCNVVFIAQMCPNTCASCYGGDPERIPSGPRIRAGSAHHKPTLVNNGASIANNPHRIHGQATASGNNVGAQIQGSLPSEGLSQSQPGRIPQAHSLPDAPAPAQGQYQAPLQQISSNTGDSTGAAQQPQAQHIQTPQQIQTPQHIQTPQLPQYTQQQVPSQQPFQQQGTQPTSYAQSSNLNTATYNQQPAASFNQFQPQPQQLNYFGQPQTQPQQQAGFFGQPQPQPGQFGAAQQQPAFGQQSGFGASSLPQTPGAQPSGTPFANPFQPFLQQTYQAQQPQPQLFQPFTLAPLATPAPLPAPAAVTPAPFQFQPQQSLAAQPQGQQALYPLQQPQQYNGQGFAQPQGQSAQGAFTLSPPPAQPAPLQPQASGQGQQNTQYSFAPNQQTQNDLSSIDAQRPRQIYNNGQSLQPPPSSPVAPPKQEPAPATNIDPTPVNVNKYASSYTDNKGIGNYGSIAKPADGSEKYSGQCPKQPNWEPCISKDIANERFRNCCARLGEGCAALCSYDQTLTTIQLAVLTGRCPIGKVGDMMVCASGYEDASTCCQAHNVFEPGYEHCRPYCNPAAGLPGANDGMSSLADKYRCLGKLSQIQRCFYVTQRP